MLESPITAEGKPTDHVELARDVPDGKLPTVYSLPKAHNEGTQSSSSTQASKGSPIRILVVGDDAAILGILKDMLLLRGHSVIATDKGEEALLLIERESFDLILTDLGMPVGSGWDVAQKTKEKNPRVPVVLITGWGTRYEGKDLSHRGVDLALSNPLSWDGLMSAIDSLL